MATLQEVSQVCNYSADEAVGLPSNGDGHAYTILPACSLGGQAICHAADTCAGPPPGQLYSVLRDGQIIGTTCLDAQHLDGFGNVTPALVLRAFRRLSWPGSALALQPADGHTLVGFPTNFYTDNTTPTVQTVRLLGQQVQIEATPSRYTWLFGDGETTDTSEPGAPYPTLGITHAYTHHGSVQPRVDTTYGGRYRVGKGPWTDIPGTLTVTGETQTLEVREAQGVLVGQ